jgi:hypothetical protein
LKHVLIIFIIYTSIIIIKGVLTDFNFSNTYLNIIHLDATSKTKTKISPELMLFRRETYSILCWPRALIAWINAVLMINDALTLRNCHGENNFILSKAEMGNLFVNIDRGVTNEK